MREMQEQQPVTDDDARKLRMAIEELLDAVAWRRAAVLAPSQCRLLIMALRKAGVL